MTETYNLNDLSIDGQRVPAGSMTVEVDWGYGSDETAVALLERKPAGNYEVKWSVPLSRRDTRRLMGRTEHLCWKCRDGRTRAHHRRCYWRGGKPERVRSGCAAEVLAAARGKPSPRRLRGLLLSQAQALGAQARKCSADAESILRELSPLTASPERLKELAALYGET